MHSSVPRGIVLLVVAAADGPMLFTRTFALPQQLRFFVQCRRSVSHPLLDIGWHCKPSLKVRLGTPWTA